LFHCCSRLLLLTIVGGCSVFVVGGDITFIKTLLTFRFNFIVVTLHCHCSFYCIPDLLLFVIMCMTLLLIVVCYTFDPVILLPTVIVEHSFVTLERYVDLLPALVYGDDLLLSTPFVPFTTVFVVTLFYYWTRWYVCHSITGIPPLLRCCSLLLMLLMLLLLLLLFVVDCYYLLLLRILLLLLLLLLLMPNCCCCWVLLSPLLLLFCCLTFLLLFVDCCCSLLPFDVGI
jgi:hypothetical protein